MSTDSKGPKPPAAESPKEDAEKDERKAPTSEKEREEEEEDAELSKYMPSRHSQQLLETCLEYVRGKPRTPRRSIRSGSRGLVWSPQQRWAMSMPNVAARGAVPNGQEQKKQGTEQQQQQERSDEVPPEAMPEGGTGCSVPAMEPEDDVWYKRAVFYEVFVRAYQDSNGDGIGDLRGLISRLDYVAGLGVDAVWLLPISKSPLRDHGYDVSDYLQIHEDYGTMADFEELVRECHRRGVRVVVEMIPNHTSSDHVWFQASRDPRHPLHQRFRDWYIWNDSDTAYAGARVIFLDTEKSNWTWDAKRGAYYYHRFFAHQPDLNYDNPLVQAEIMANVEFWAAHGVDGIRVDAPPYLFKREGTSCESLPETHQFFRKLRQFADEMAAETGRPRVMLLCEANQWPADVVPYFGTAAEPEFSMAFHFPLMPRVFMALARESRTPVLDILARTPPIPAAARATCCWGTFLRNHDELTLEMVSPAERAALWAHYAPDPRMRLNLGIRRRLCPLLAYAPARVRLAHSVLLTLCGSPFLYYGDEIGMGDNTALPDRSGVRTPMQWDASRNAGFSAAPPARLYLPVIADGPCRYTTTNVAAQDAAPASLLHWVRRALAIRRSLAPTYLLHDDSLFVLTSTHGSVPEAVLAYLRFRCVDDDDNNDSNRSPATESALLVLNNLSAREQTVTLNALPALLRAECGTLVAEELFTHDTLFVAPKQPLHVVLPPLAFHWFLLHH